jgi:hypothetical protein
VTGSIGTHGGGAVPGSAAPLAGGGVLAGSVKQGARGLSRKGLIGIVGGVVAVAIVTVSAIALNRDDTITADPAPGGSGPAVSSAPPSAIPTPTPTPTPTPSAPATQNFRGVYRFEAVVIKSTVASEPVGRKQTATWTVTTTCSGNTCKSKVSVGSTKETLVSKGTGWSNRVKSQGECINLATGAKTGQRVPTLYTRTLTPVATKGNLITKITGTDRFQQLKDCRNQRVKKVDVTKRITITFQR